MSILERFRTHTASLPHASVDEHQAVVELLALAAYADDTVTDDELEELAQFDSSHASWDDEAFSMLQHLPVAIAHARDGSSTVAGATARIVAPELRTEAVASVEALLSVGGIAPAESAFLTQVRQALSH